MKYTTLPGTDLRVSRLCLGTMTFGEQNTEAEAHAQLDRAVERGVNFLDTAEVYPIPPSQETCGRTEAYIGTWLKARGGRDKLVIATKVAGAGNGARYLRDGLGGRLDRASIRAACDASLKRLQTDYIDLYQTHTPDRPMSLFNRPADRPADYPGAPIEETLAALEELRRAGKIRHIGVSNETPWGVMTWLRHAEAGIGPRIATIQNSYNLLTRAFDGGLAEIAIAENVGLLPYSVLAMAVLTGKYFDGQRPAGARLTRYTRFVRYTVPRAEPAAKRYVALARAHGLDPGQMAIAWTLTRPFVPSAILGATTLAQLDVNLGAIEVTLPDTVISGIEAIHAEMPSPCA